MSWRAPGSILEAPGLDFGGFWDHFFEIWGLLARKMQELIANLKPKLRDSSLELELNQTLKAKAKCCRLQYSGYPSPNLSPGVRG